MATAASRTPLLLLLAAASTLAASADVDQVPITLPHCQDKCGNVSIPYPFGINAGCFHPGFEVVCNGTFDPPRLFLATDKLKVTHFYYSSTESNPPHRVNDSLSPVEIMDISVSEGQLRIHGAFSFDCRENETYHTSSIQGVYLPKKTPFHFSQERNMLLVIGRKVEASMPLKCGTLQVRTAGQCLGKGWCNASIQMNTGTSRVQITPGHGANDTEWRASPCTYGMVVEDSWYRFSPHDLDGDSFLQRNKERGVPVVLDFAILGVGCPAEGETVPKDYACVSENSGCADGPILSNGPSHYCTCSKGFHGNPYILRGCQGRQAPPIHSSLHNFIH